MKEEKTSKVTSITKKDKPDKFGNDQYTIEFENEDKGLHACKNLKFKGGEEITYEIEHLEGTSKEGKEYSFYKITLPKDENSSYGGGFKKAYTPYVEPVEKQAIILAQSQTANACILIANGIIKLEEGKKLSTLVQELASSLMTITIKNAVDHIDVLKLYSNKTE